MFGALKPLLGAIFNFNFGGCFGDFDKVNFVNSDYLNRLYSCNTIPIRDDMQYGVLAGRVGISPTHQLDLMAKNMWTTPRATVVPTLCIAMRHPTSNCNKATLAFTINADAVVTMLEVTPGESSNIEVLRFYSITDTVIPRRRSG